MSRRLDFDQFRRERSGEPVMVAVGGIEYLLPPQLPAATALDIIALNRTAEPCPVHAAKQGTAEMTCSQCKNPDATPEQIFDLAEPLFGRGTLRRIASDHDLSVDELGDLIIKVFQLYNEGVPNPNRAARRARSPRRAARTSG